MIPRASLGHFRIFSAILRLRVKRIQLKPLWVRIATMNHQIGYCTNVHAGAGLDATRANLAQHALAVKQSISPNHPFGVGLWLSSAAVGELLAQRRITEFAAWLADVGLVPFTLNGFPYCDFHQETVKYQVYEPTWSERSRRDYTLGLVDILNGLLPEGVEGSISTLPLEWGTPRPTIDQMAAAAASLLAVVDHLSRLEAECDRLIYLAIEPEPGCVLQRSGDVVTFFEEFLLRQGDERLVRRHLRVCHDVCHAAVMFEEQDEAIGRYRSAGIGIGKVQVSSAVILPLDRIEPGDRAAAIDQLRGFAEDRYLHQTVVRRASDETPVFYDDLPDALQSIDGATALCGEWRVHFHVPIYLERFGLLETSRQQILQCLEAARDFRELEHFEVETYAWSVLPQALRQPRLADGIAEELKWFRDRWTTGNPKSI